MNIKIVDNFNKESLNIIQSEKEEYSRKKYLIVDNPCKACIKLIIYTITLSILIISFFVTKKIKNDSPIIQEKDKNISTFNNTTKNISITNETSPNIPITDDTSINISTFTDKTEIIPISDENSEAQQITDDTYENIYKNISDTIEKEEKSDEVEEKHIYIPKPLPRKSSFTLKDYQDYYQLAKEGKFLYKENLVQSKWPFISVIIGLYNAERYINATLKSVQNQRMKNIEIIIVDDRSTDKSLLYVEEAQKIDPRIVIMKNQKNMAILYTKSIGVLMAKGDYIFVLDDDDIVVVDDLFEIIYEEATERNFDIIEYKWMDSNSYDLNERTVSMNPFCVHRVGLELTQPALRRRFNRDEKGNHQMPDRFIWGRLIVRDVYVKVVDAIGEIDIQKRFTEHDDTITTFMLFKYASSFKKIGKVGLCHFWNAQTASAESQRWNPERILRTCLSFVNYAEIMYKHTENEYQAKEEAFWVFRSWVLRTKCNSYEKTLNQAVNLAKQFYKDPMITSSQKNEIKSVFGKYLN